MRNATSPPRLIPRCCRLVQLIRRNDELALLYEKIRIQESSLEKGAQHYRMRVKEVDMLRQQIIDVQKEITGLGGSVAAMHTLRNEVYQLQRELLQERTKVRTEAIVISKACGVCHPHPPKRPH